MKGFGVSMDILLIESDDCGKPDLSLMKNVLSDIGIEMVILVPPIAYLGNMAIDRLEEIHKLIHEVIDGQ